MEFKTQICTTREQSKRLLDLGISESTADMTWHYTGSRCELLLWEIRPHPPTTRKTFVGDLEKFGEDNFERIWGKDVPAWSLHRLLMICRMIVPTISMYHGDRLFDWLIGQLQTYINSEEFNPEYLGKGL